MSQDYIFAIMDQPASSPHCIDISLSSVSSCSCGASQRHSVVRLFSDNITEMEAFYPGLMQPSRNNPLNKWNEAIIR